MKDRKEKNSKVMREKITLKVIREKKRSKRKKKKNSR